MHTFYPKLKYYEDAKAIVERIPTEDGVKMLKSQRKIADPKLMLVKQKMKFKGGKFRNDIIEKTRCTTRSYKKIYKRVVILDPNKYLTQLQNYQVWQEERYV